jgi:hypothetical protein
VGAQTYDVNLSHSGREDSEKARAGQGGCAEAPFSVPTKRVVILATKAMNAELLWRGELNIVDAAFVRDHFIPAAMKSERWNIVVFEAFRTIELLIKGILCLSGHAPRQSHDVQYLIDDFLKLLAPKKDSQPFLYSAASPAGHAYGIYWDGTSIQLLEKVAGLYTVLASTEWKQMPSIDRLLRLRLDVEGFTVSVYCSDELILQMSHASIPDATRFSRSFNRALDPAKVKTLRRAAERLRATREDAFFGTVSFSKEDAEAAMSLMNSALEASKAFVMLTG